MIRHSEGAGCCGEGVGQSAVSASGALQTSFGRQAFPATPQLHGYPVCGTTKWQQVWHTKGGGQRCSGVPFLCSVLLQFAKRCH